VQQLPQVPNISAQPKAGELPFFRKPIFCIFIPEVCEKMFNPKRPLMSRTNPALQKIMMKIEVSTWCFHTSLMWPTPYGRGLPRGKVKKCKDTPYSIFKRTNLSYHNVHDKSIDNLSPNPCLLYKKPRKYAIIKRF